MLRIFHIALRAEWQAADLDGPGYAPAAFAEEGFIHCSTAAQVLPSAERHFPGHPDLVLVALDPDALGAELRWEHAPSVGEDFPHLYRHVLATDVRGCAPFTRAGDGAGPYALPEGIEGAGLDEIADRSG